MTTTTLDLKGILDQRGLRPVAFQAGWRPQIEDGEPGWSYPLFDPFTGDRLTVRRWKNAISKHEPKYRWCPKNAKRPPYYALPTLKDAIAEAGGILHIAAGEPDLITLHAAGLYNSLCWFGELAVPKTLAEDLIALGVKHVIYYPDLDQVGLKAARRVMKRLRGSAIDLEVRLLPYEIVETDGDGIDLNKVWQECLFEPGTFLAVLASSILMPDTPEEPEQLTDPGVTNTESDREELDEVGRRVCQEIARVLKKRGDKPGNYECPYPGHGSGGKDFLFDPDTGLIGGCMGKHDGMLSQPKRWKDLAAFLNIDVSQIARDVWQEHHPLTPPPLSPPCTEPPPEPSDYVPDTPAPSKNGKSNEHRPVPIISTRTALTTLSRLVNGDELLDIMPILAPYKPFRQFQGVIELWVTGLVLLIIGPSGMGKTALLETLQDLLEIAGLDWIGWGPEWSPTNYQMRRITGWGGPSVRAQRLDFLWRKEDAAKVPTEKRNGIALSDTDRAKINRIMDHLTAWPGEGHYIDQAREPLTYLLEKAEEKVWELRRAGRRVQVFFLDYIQKLQRKGGDWAELEFSLNEIWQFAQDQKLFAIVTSQVNKGQGARVRRGNYMLDENAAQQLSDQQANAMLTINPVFDLATGDRLERAWLRAVKNSEGPTPCKIEVKTALHRHRWRSDILTDLVKDTYKTVPDDDDDDPGKTDDTAPIDLPLEWYQK